MIRFCSLIALFELAMLAAFVGLPAAQADPAEECCGLDNSEQCSGCIAGYLLPRGSLFGCLTTGLAMGCELNPRICNEIIGPIVKWDANCHIYKEISLGISVQMPGCDSTECD